MNTIQTSQNTYTTLIQELQKNNPQCYHTKISKGKGKAVPVTARGGP
jgi:hypothetical protein